jgi:hypothetical protein
MTGHSEEHSDPGTPHGLDLVLDDVVIRRLVSLSTKAQCADPGDTGRSGVPSRCCAD